ncbi:MAG: transcriptional regulator [Candidatus Buchananbacteria bacterium RBG_13_39_9]|uniref:Probable transcriptional regulatory protein A2Y67_02220 n=1 Tax=Candidatus Buchananbacteria bacterium RBG_13_39_9 TaxID=1797531 RepID=A0A1G1XMP5_9BACT|nr:MAG: transcriptional regulator [Candidatus Buchananbacteria bacterium RBG_13_39_9]
MSGHSKWATTKRAKGASDAKRAILFTKLAKSITVAARDKGGDPTTNFSLRLAMDKAKAANMPKENIERSIKRGTGELEGAAIEEMAYEGFGPAGVAVIVKCLTDNKNRASQELKHLFSKYGGSLAGPGAVAWQFEHKGVIRLNNEQLAGKTWEDLELQLIDLGAQDIKKEEDGIIIFCAISDLQKVKKGLEDLGFNLDDAGMEYVAKEKIKVDDETSQKIAEFLESLDENEDVDDYYTNLND